MLDIYPIAGHRKCRNTRAVAGNPWVTMARLRKDRNNARIYISNWVIGATQTAEAAILSSYNQ